VLEQSSRLSISLSRLAHYGSAAEQTSARHGDGRTASLRLQPGIGGLKASGHGKNLSLNALEDYTVPRNVMIKLSLLQLVVM
jgi:hypothetical protein